MSNETITPAFPTNTGLGNHQAVGMTLRDYFAAKAMQGLITSPRKPTGAEQDVTDVLVANLAYKMSDAMLKARTK